MARLCGVFLSAIPLLAWAQTPPILPLRGTGFLGRVSLMTPIPARSAVVSARPIGRDNSRHSPARSRDRSWYHTGWGILAIGTVATTATFAIDRSVNNYASQHINYTARHDALNAADVVTWGTVAFAGLTWFQSPWASPKLAHASSVAILATVFTTVEVAGLKFATGRERPTPNNSPMHFHFFDRNYANPIGGAQFFSGANTSSFPAGHAAVIWSLVTPYAQNYHNPWLYAIPVAVSLTRITTPDGHWASDVVGGAFLGYLTADLTNEYFPKTDFGVTFFGDGISIYKQF